MAVEPLRPPRQTMPMFHSDRTEYNGFFRMSQQALNRCDLYAILVGRDRYFVRKSRYGPTGPMNEQEFRCHLRVSELPVVVYIQDLHPDERYAIMIEIDRIENPRLPLQFEWSLPKSRPKYDEKSETITPEQYYENLK